MFPFRQGQFHIPDAVKNAHTEYQREKQYHYQQHRKLASRLHIDKASVEGRQEFLEEIPTIFLPCFKEEYPPCRHDVCENEEIQAMWNEYRNKRKHPDPREAHAMGCTWAETLVLDEEKLQKVVGEDESVIICNSKTGDIAGVVIRNASGDPGVLKWVTEIIQKNVGWRRNVRVCILHHPHEKINIDHFHCRKQTLAIYVKLVILLGQEVNQNLTGPATWSGRYLKRTSMSSITSQVQLLHCSRT